MAPPSENSTLPSTLPTPTRSPPEISMLRRQHPAIQLQLAGSLHQLREAGCGPHVDFSLVAERRFHRKLRVKLAASLVGHTAGKGARPARSKVAGQVQLQHPTCCYLYAT